MVIFALLMRVGVISKEACERCDDLSATRAVASGEVTSS
jgi:hypothetical protein